MLLSILLIAWVVFFAHTITCINRTSAERLGLLEKIRDYDDLDNWGARLNALRHVDFDAHLWRRVTLRDPWAIYPDSLVSLVRVEA